MAAARTLLELDLGRGLLEVPPADPVAAFRRRHIPMLRDLIENLRLAGQSRNVAGLIVHVGPENLKSAQVEELGIALEAFGASGKRTFAWTEAFGETGNGTLSYHLASFCDEIWMQPSGMLGLVGAAFGGTFLRGALNRAGVEPQFRMRHEYKNAPDAFMREEMGEPQRESLQRLTDSQVEQVIETVARRRKLSQEVVRQVISDAPLCADEAVKRGFIDHLGYRDEAYAAARRYVSPDRSNDSAEAGTVDVPQRYLQRWAPPKLETMVSKSREQIQRQANRALSVPQKRRVVGVVDVAGGIMLGRSGSSPLGSPHTGSDTACAALRQARESSDIDAVVIRIDSPGGSYVASDAIHREIGLLREAGKPVVASMATYAASGGYFAAMGADEIFALPSTLTGSIGVFAGKMVIQEAMKKIGIGHETVQTGSQSTMWAASKPFEESELARLDTWLDEVYDDFTKKAAVGRDMAHEELEPLARGRVWSGADAKERGLVDELGGLEQAIAAATVRVGGSRDAVSVRRLPNVPAIARLKAPVNSDSPNAEVSFGSPWLRCSDVELSLSSGPERLLSDLANWLGTGSAHGVLRIPLLGQ